MKKVINFILLMIVTSTVYGQADYTRTNPTANNSANLTTFNKGSIVDANLKARLTLFIPRMAAFGLNNAKDSAGAVAFNTATGRMGVYLGGGVWKSIATTDDAPLLSATSPIQYNSGTGVISILTASGSQNGALLSTDWTTFNNKVSSVSGRSKRITSSGGTTPVIDISSSYVGQSSITTLGTIGTGVWNGTAIADSYISSSSNWNTAYSDRLKWDGGSTGLTASTGRTSLGGTTVGQNIFTSTNPSAITFLRANADNTVSWLDASAFRTAIGATGTVTSVTGTANQITVTGTTAPVISLPATITGLTSVTSTGFTGALTGNASTATLAANSTLWNNQGYNSTPVTSGSTYVLVFSPSDNKYHDVSNANFISTLGLATSSSLSGYLPLTGGTLSGTLNGTTINGTSLSITGSGIFGGNVIPNATNTYSSGISSFRWSNVYSVLGDFTGALTGTSATFTTSVATPSILMNGNNTLFGFNGDTFIRPNLTTKAVKVQNFAGSNIVQFNEDFTSIFTGAISGTSATLTTSVQSWGLIAEKAGSNTIGAGPYTQIGSATNNRYWIDQMNASFGRDTWFYNGSAWGVKHTLDASGNNTWTGSGAFGSAVSSTGFNVTTGGSGLNLNSGDAILDYVSSSVRLRTYNGSGYITPLTIANTGGITAGYAITVPDVAYDASTWDANLTVPTKNAIRDFLKPVGSNYAPTISGASGITTSSASTSYYVKTGNMLVMSGTLNVNASTTGGSSLNISIPAGMTVDNVGLGSGAISGTGFISNDGFQFNELIIYSTGSNNIGFTWYAPQAGVTYSMPYTVTVFIQ